MDGKSSRLRDNAPEHRDTGPTWRRDLEATSTASRRPGAPLMDIGAAAERLSVSVRLVRRLVFERRIPYLKIGKYVRFDPDALDRWVQEQRVEPHAS
jgi:excisionase family DNA binding protein